jgi:NhaP-type Na+/H+ or K+/H+ antiporter
MIMASCVRLEFCAILTLTKNKVFKLTALEAMMMAVSDIIVWTFVFILFTAFVTIVTTAVLMRQAKRHPRDPQEPKEDDWDRDDWSKDDWKKGGWDK